MKYSESRRLDVGAHDKKLKSYWNHFQDDLKFFQDTFWRERLLGSRELSEEKIRKRMEYLNIRMEGPLYCVAIFAPYLMEKEAEVIDPLLMRMLRSIGEGYRSAGLECHTLPDDYFNAIAILSLQSEKECQKFEKVTRALTTQMMNHYEVELFVGVGDFVDSVAAVSRSRAAAAEALAYKFSFSQDHVINARDVDRYYKPTAKDLKLHYDRILGCFYDGNLVRMAVRFGDMRNAVRSVSENEIESLRNICIELTAAILRRAHEMGVETAPEIDGIYTYIAQIQSADEIENWFIGYCTGLLQKIAALRQDKNCQIVKLAQDYIETNLGSRDLTLQAVSDYVDLSPAYFSAIFSKETGGHVNDYINATRIRAAKRLLLTSNDKVVTIAERLGFSSSSYFNNVFKRYVGVTPKQYRDSGGKAGV